jgi:hypothetical protein
MTKINISLVIPARDDYDYLNTLLLALSRYQASFSEILIIDSSKNFLPISDDLQQAFVVKGTFIQHSKFSSLYPGAARNMGVKKSTEKVIAFLDTKTIPLERFFHYCTQFSLDQENNIVLGQTLYTFNGYFQKLVLATSYGFKPLNTVPGMIISKENFQKVGNFLPNLQCSEDTDWLQRLYQHSLNVVRPPESTVNYQGLKDLNYRSLLVKWYRNYRACRTVPHLRDHRILYLTFFTFILFTFAFNWNELFAEWDQSSQFYIPNIMNYLTAFFIFLYFMLRSFILPVSRGARVSFLLKGSFIPIFLIGLSIDLVKFLAFLPSRNLSSLFKRSIHHTSR